MYLKMDTSLSCRFFCSKITHFVYKLINKFIFKSTKIGAHSPLDGGGLEFELDERHQENMSLPSVQIFLGMKVFHVEGEKILLLLFFNSAVFLYIIKYCFCDSRSVKCRLWMQFKLSKP